MSCCQHCEGIEREFDARTASSDLKRYRTRGPLPGTRILLDALRGQGIGGMTLLDIGGGIGAILHELLESGVSSATYVDASTAYLEVAREETRRRGNESSVSFLHGDFVELAPELRPADIVTLDRVICCYPDMERLVGLSAARARRLYGLVYPRDTWWLRSFVPLSNLYFRLRRSPFRSYLHPPEAVDAVVRGHGLQRVFHRALLVWQVVLYARQQRARSQPARFGQAVLEPEVFLKWQWRAEVPFDRAAEWQFLLPLRQAVLAYAERVLGPEHPTTLTAVNDLGLLLESCGRFDEAERLFRRAAEGYEALLGPEHAFTRIARGNLDRLEDQQEAADER